MRACSSALEALLVAILLKSSRLPLSGAARMRECISLGGDRVECRDVGTTLDELGTSCNDRSIRRSCYLGSPIELVRVQVGPVYVSHGENAKSNKLRTMNDERKVNKSSLGGQQHPAASFRTIPLPHARQAYRRGLRNLIKR